MRTLFHGAALGMILLGGWLLLAQENEEKKAITITHGPILGRPGAHTMGVWARTSHPGAFVVRYGTDKAMRKSTRPVPTSFEHDCTGWTLLTGLEANTLYYYQVMPEGEEKSEHGGTFLTLPDPRDYMEPKLNPKGLFNFRFEVGCCNNQTPGQGAGSTTPAFKTMLEKLKGKIYFAIQNGDWLYEDRAIIRSASGRSRLVPMCVTFPDRFK